MSILLAVSVFLMAVFALAGNYLAGWHGAVGGACLALGIVIVCVILVYRGSD